MKPLRLTIEGFGSFAGSEVIDFAALAPRGLFVVTGPTGAGKSTIFDAMVYALYGRLPGDRNVGEVRSQHVDHATPTRVTFDFEVAGSTYRVTRNPTYERASKRGKGTATENASANLTASGAESTAITGADACTARITEIVGLDAAQFERVVLLPQGKFDQFLVAGDDVREKLLSTLFGGATYRGLTDRFKALADQSQTALEDSDREIANHRSEAWAAINRAERRLALGDEDNQSPEGSDDVAEVPSNEDIDAAIASATVAVNELARRRDAAAKRATEARAAATAAHDAAIRFENAEALRNDIDALLERTESIEKTREAVALSASARAVCDAHTETDQALSELSRASEHLTEVRQELASVMWGLGCPSAESPDLSPMTAAAEVADARSILASDKQHLEAATNAVMTLAEEANAQRDVFADVVSANVTWLAAHRRLETAQERVRVASRHAGQVSSAERAHEAAYERLEARLGLDRLRTKAEPLRTALDTAIEEHKDAMLRYVANEAPRLAEKLIDGKPCPVCGAEEHPAPAVPSAETEQIAYGSVLAAIQAETDARVALSTNTERIADAEANLGDDATVQLECLTGAVEDALQTLESANAADAELLAAQEGLDLARDDRERAHRALIESGSDFRVACDNARRAREAAATAKAEAAGLDSDEVGRRDALLQDADDLTERFDDAVTALNVAGEDVRRLGDAAKKALADSPFDSFEAARSALFDQEREDGNAQQVAAFDDDLKKKTAKYEAVLKLGVPDVKPDFDALDSAAKSDEELHARLAERATLVEEHLSSASERLKTAVRLTEDSEAERAHATRVRTIHETFSGKGVGVSMNLYRWVLAGELERVALAANEHLRRLTDRRYEVRPGERLVLNIFDTHTGAERSARSLSGGERFQVSLALALGLADVVSHGGTGSGHSYDALFLDEGFGSLDPEALDDAIGTLVALQASGRIVGAITHVEAMKEQLHVGIEVRRRADGAGSTLVVNP